jgi:ABC-type glycerol-3-phosphate transport system permease component
MQSWRDWAATTWLDKLYSDCPINNLFLVIIVVWLRLGMRWFFLGCDKGIPKKLSSSRVDGATEIQIFFRIMILYFGDIITVTKRSLSLP